jgi:hypothetical protein
MDEISQMFFFFAILFSARKVIRVASCNAAPRQQESIMRPLDIPAIEQHARELRAAEIQRIQGLFAARGALLFRLASGSLLAGLAAASEALRPLFSWNPQAGTPVLAPSLGPLLNRLNRGARTLFSWNPQQRRSGG